MLLNKQQISPSSNYSRYIGKRIKLDSIYKNKIIYYLIYTSLFLVLFFLTFHSFYFEKRSFVWESDGLGQYIVNLYALYTKIYTAIGNFFTDGTMSLSNYSFSVGLGADVLGSYFVSIPEYLGAIFKRQNIEMIYNLIIVFKIYLTGIAFSWLCRHFNRPYISTLVGSFIYVFSGFTLYYGVRHPQFIMPLILLPCLIVGLDNIIRGKSPILFSILIFYSLWIDYYFLYMNTIILGIFFVTRYFMSKKKKKITDFLITSFKIVVAYLIGIGMAFIPFMSKVQDFFNSPRTQGNTIDRNELLSYGKNWIGNFTSRLFAPYTQSDYLQYYMLFAVVSLVLPVIIVLLLRKTAKMKVLKIWLLISIVFFVFPIFGYVFSGFSATINRWSYGFVLLVAFIATTILPFMNSIGKKEICVIGIAMVIYCVICYLYKAKEDVSVIIGSFLMLLSFFFVIIYVYLLKHQRKKLAYSSLLLLIAINLFVNGEYLYSESKGGFASEFVEKDGVLMRFDSSLDAAASNIEDRSFYRTELFTNSQYTAGFPKVWNYNGTSIYSSTNNKNLIQYGEDMENIGALTVANFYNFDGRSFLEALSSVKYYVIEEGKESFVPLGFEFKKFTENGGKTIGIYENTNYLPLGYTYSSVMSEKQYNKLNAVQKQEAMLQAAIIEKSGLENVKQEDITFTSIRQEYKAYGKNVHVEEKRFIVDKNDSILNIEFDTSGGNENYIEIKGLSVAQVSKESLALSISASNGVEKGIWVPTADDLYRLNENNYLINLCDNKDKKIVVKIRFPFKGEYTFKELNVFSQSTGNLKDYVSDLKSESLTDVNINGDIITGKIFVNEPKILCLSIPYSKGWGLYLDGTPIKTEKVNKMYLGAEIPKGKHEVKLVYSPYGLEYWCVITIISIVGFCAMALIYRKNKTRRGLPLR